MTVRPVLKLSLVLVSVLLQMTESERRYHEKKLARDVERAKQSAHTSHRERVNVRIASA